MYTMIPEAMRCTPGHRSCSWHHAQLVSDYRTARTAAEEQYDVLYGGTIEEWAEHRHELITFKEWLCSSRK